MPRDHSDITDALNGYIGDILRNYVHKHNLRNQKILGERIKEAAKQAGRLETDFEFDGAVHNWFYASRCTEIPIVLKAIGCESIQEAWVKYATHSPRPENVAVTHQSFKTESERTFLTNLAGAKVLRETRIMIVGAPESKINHTNKLISRLLRDQHITVYKIEQLTSLERTVQLLCNIRLYPRNYKARLFNYRKLSDNPPLYENFAIFDERSVISVWLNAFGMEEGGPYLSFYGSSFAGVYLNAWERMWFSAMPFSGHSDGLDMALEHLKSINKPISKQELEEAVEKRCTDARDNDNPPRY